MSDRLQLFKQIGEISFTLDDLTLYLDTHPLDVDALDLFAQTSAQKKGLMEEYAKKFEPLSMYCVCPDTNNERDTYTKYPKQKHFTWCDGPLPWDNQPVEGGVR